MKDTNSPTLTKREAWIAQRVNALLADGWKSPELAAKRAARDWRNQSPAHKAAVKRNNAMAAARNAAYVAAKVVLP